VQQLADQARDVNRSLHLVAVGLWLLAGLLALVAVLAAGVAIALSPLTPIGVARTADPAPGFAYDVPVLLTALAGTIAVVVLLALWPAWRTARAAVALGGRDEPGLARRSIVADTCARAGLTVTSPPGCAWQWSEGAARPACPSAPASAAPWSG
jgi:hypothetical protein